MEILDEDLRDYCEYAQLMAREGQVEAAANGHIRLEALFTLIHTNSNWKQFLEQMRSNTTNGG